LIFVCTGSRKFQFNRLIKKIDELVGSGDLNEEVFAQIGVSTYIPKNFKYASYISSDKFNEYQSKADIIITHGGTGAMLGALKLEKQVIAVPRLFEYDEHSDDHQTQVAGVLSKEGYLLCVTDMDDLLKSIQMLKRYPIDKQYQKPSQVISIIEQFISNDMKKP
jgi:UDP-N-acetylglucosamine transferase subunit ALG13